MADGKESARAGRFVLGRPIGATVKRAFVWMESRAEPFASHELAAAIHTVKRNAQHILGQLHEHGIVHIAAWRKFHGEGARGRYPLRLWAFGPGVDAPVPKPDEPKVIMARRRKRLIEKHGVKVANRILESRKGGGASVLTVDGVVVYRRGKPRGNNCGRLSA